MTSDAADFIPITSPWTRRLAGELAIPKRRGPLTPQGFAWMVTGTELMLIEMRRLVRRLERNRAYRKRRRTALRELKDAAELRRFRQQIQREGQALIRSYIREQRLSLR